MLIFSALALLSLIAIPASASSVTVDIDQTDVFPSAWIPPNNWPPFVDVSSTNVTKPNCGEPSQMVQRERQDVLGWEACVETSEEGAAGTSYHNAKYELVKDGKFVTIEWTLREVHCENYDEPHRGQCRAGQGAFWDAYSPLSVLRAVLTDLDLFGDESEDHDESGRIESAEFLDDFDTLVIDLPWGMPDSYVQIEYEMRDVGAAVGGFQVRADGETRVKIHDFRRYVIFEGSTGKGQVELKYCKELKDATHSVSCGPTYELAIDAEADTDFEDVSPDHPNADAITYALEHGIASGYPDGTFLPDSSTNRAEFTKLVTLYTFGQAMIDMCNTRIPFFDVPDTWYTKYVCRAQDAHLIGGYPDGSFQPARTINFAEAAKILVLGDDFGSYRSDLDENESDPWYKRYVRYLADKNAIPMSVYSLTQPITRGQTVEIIYRLKTGNNDKPSRTYEELAN